MIRKEYKFGQDARDAIVRVANNIGDTLGKTLGPAGRNYQIPNGITNDGVSILEHIRFTDECEDNVAIAFHEVAKRTDRDAGDGTTSSIVIAAELATGVIKYIPDLDTPTPGQRSVMDISRQLEDEKTKAVALLEKNIVPVKTLEQLEKVAFTAMEDKEAAKIVADTIFKAGAHSHTALDEGFNSKLEVSLQAGIEVPLKLNYGESAEAIDAPVLVVNHVFEDYLELKPFMSGMVEFLNNNKLKIEALVIVAKKFSIPFMQKVAQVNTLGHVKIICLSNDHLDDSLFEDVAAFVDAKYVDTHPKSGKKITDITFNQYCGGAARVTANAKGAVFYGGKGTKLQEKQETTRVQARILQIQEELKEEKDVKRRDILEKRIAEFQGGKATIYVDAKTAAEKYYLKLKVQDCMNSCKAALDGGMVRGGGLTLKKVAEEMGTDSILYNALMAPYNRIQQNAGGNLEIGEDVFDSYQVVKAGLENAVSVVKTLITIEGVIADHPKSLVSDLQDVITG